MWSGGRWGGNVGTAHTQPNLRQIHFHSFSFFPDWEVLAGDTRSRTQCHSASYWFVKSWRALDTTGTARATIQAGQCLKFSLSLIRFIVD